MFSQIRDSLSTLLAIVAFGIVSGIILAVGITSIYNSCESNNSASAATFESERKERRAEWSDCVYLFTDPETKVQYIYFFSCGKAGICPRYTADGGLYVENGKNKSASF